MSSIATDKTVLKICTRTRIWARQHLATAFSPNEIPINGLDTLRGMCGACSVAVHAQICKHTSYDVAFAGAVLENPSNYAVEGHTFLYACHSKVGYVIDLTAKQFDLSQPEIVIARRTRKMQQQWFWRLGIRFNGVPSIMNEFDGWKDRINPIMLFDIDDNDDRDILYTKVMDRIDSDLTRWGLAA